MLEGKKVKGFIVTAPNSGSGKTIVTLGLIAALRASGLKVVASKTGPDYIDTSFHSHASGAKANNLDPWAMNKMRLRALANAHAADADMLVVEGVMGLFDGAANGVGSTADLAEILDLPVLLVVDAARQSQSIAALVFGFANWRSKVRLAGIILNNVASQKHEKILRDALSALDVPIVGVIARDKKMVLPSRHLGLVLPEEIEGLEGFVEQTAETIATQCDLQTIQSIAGGVPCLNSAERLAPLGQHVAIAKDAAFAFIYQHWLDDWRAAGAEVSFFSPLENEAPNEMADAVFLPGGYPELHGARLAQADKFMAGLQDIKTRGGLIYGECGGYMVMGEALIDKDGVRHKMSGLLPHTTSIDQPRRVLGYRVLQHSSALPWPEQLGGHEFHYSSSSNHNLPPLFLAKDALGIDVAPMGAMDGNVMGSYAHVIDIWRGGHD